jgi:hypothetical protein
MQTIFEVGEIPWKPFVDPPTSNITYFASKEEALKLCGIGIHHQKIKEITVYSSFKEYELCKRNAEIKTRALAKLDAEKRRVLGL